MSSFLPKHPHTHIQILRFTDFCFLIVAAAATPASDADELLRTAASSKFFLGSAFPLLLEFLHSSVSVFKHLTALRSILKTHKL